LRRLRFFERAIAGEDKMGGRTVIDGLRSAAPTAASRLVCPP